MVARLFPLLLAGAFFVYSGTESSAEDIDIGPLFSRVGLTFDEGYRIQALGPIFNREVGVKYDQWGISPLVTRHYDHETDNLSIDFIWKVAEYDRMGPEYRFAFLQFFNFSGGRTLQEENDKKFTLFPFYFQNRSANPERDYTAVFPFYGNIHSRLFRDEVKWVMAPFYVETRKKDVVTRNVPLPLVHFRSGDNLRGWQFWPLIGDEYKGVTQVTNVLGEVRLVAPHEKSFFLWPIFMERRSGIGTREEDWQRTFLPFYYLRRSSGRNVTTALWPFFSYTDDLEREYKEWGMPYPVVVFARGPGKNAARFWPIYGQARNDTIKTRFVLMPIYRSKEVTSENLHRKRWGIAYFIYDHVDELNTETGQVYKRRNQLPLFAYNKRIDGTEYLQIFALLEPILPNSDTLYRTLSPLWSIWRTEKNENTGKKTHSFLWNLFRREKTPTTKKTSFLLGLFQHESNEDGKSLRLLFLPRIRWGDSKDSKPALEAGVQTTP